VYIGISLHAALAGTIWELLLLLLWLIIVVPLVSFSGFQCRHLDPREQGNEKGEVHAIVFH